MTVNENRKPIKGRMQVQQNRATAWSSASDVCVTPPLAQDYRRGSRFGEQEIIAVHHMTRVFKISGITVAYSGGDGNDHVDFLKSRTEQEKIGKGFSNR
jgi:hypothetical protein